MANVFERQIAITFAVAGVMRASSRPVNDPRRLDAGRRLGAAVATPVEESVEMTRLAEMLIIPGWRSASEFPSDSRLAILETAVRVGALRDDSLLDYLLIVEEQRENYHPNILRQKRAWDSLIDEMSEYMRGVIGEDYQDAFARLVQKANQYRR